MPHCMAAICQSRIAPMTGPTLPIRSNTQILWVSWAWRFAEKGSRAASSREANARIKDIRYFSVLLSGSQCRTATLPRIPCMTGRRERRAVLFAPECSQQPRYEERKNPGRHPCGEVSTRCTAGMSEAELFQAVGLVAVQRNRVIGADHAEQLVDLVEMGLVIVVPDHLAEMAGAAGDQAVVGFVEGGAGDGGNIIKHIEITAGKGRGTAPGVVAYAVAGDLHAVTAVAGRHPFRVLGGEGDRA